MTASSAITADARPRKFGSRLAFWMALGAPLAVVLALGGAYSWAWVPAQFCLTAGLVVVLIGGAWRGRLPGHILLVPTGLFGLLVLVQWAAGLSQNPAATLTALLQLSCGGAVLYLSYYAFHSARNLRYLSVGLWLFTGLLAMEAIAQYFDAGKFIFWVYNATYGTPVGPFVYHNHYAGAMDLLLPVSVAAALRPIAGVRPDGLAMIRRSLLPALAFISVIISQSRGGFLTLIVEGLLAIAIFWAPIRHTRGGFRKLAVAVAAFLAFSMVASWKPLLNRLTHLEYHDLSAVDRLAVADACLRIWRAHPWVGSGFGTFAVVYPAYEAFDNGLNWDHAHNEYAQALAETGALGAICILAFLTLLARAAWPRGAERLTSAEIYRRACSVGIAGFLVHSYGDFLFHSPGDMMLFFLLTGAAVAVARPSGSARPLGQTSRDLAKDPRPRLAAVAALPPQH